MKVENGDYIVAIDLGTNTVVAMIGTKGEDGRIRVCLLYTSDAADE